MEGRVVLFCSQSPFPLRDHTSKNDGEYPHTDFTGAGLPGILTAIHLASHCSILILIPSEKTTPSVLKKNINKI